MNPVRNLRLMQYTYKMKNKLNKQSNNIINNLQKYLSDISYF